VTSCGLFFRPTDPVPLLAELVCSVRLAPGSIELISIGKPDASIERIVAKSTLFEAGPRAIAERTLENARQLKVPQKLAGTLDGTCSDEDVGLNDCIMSGLRLVQHCYEQRFSAYEVVVLASLVGYWMASLTEETSIPECLLSYACLAEAANNVYCFPFKDVPEIPIIPTEVLASEHYVFSLRDIDGELCDQIEDAILNFDWILEHLLEAPRTSERLGPTTTLEDAQLAMEQCLGTVLFRRLCWRARSLLLNAEILKDVTHLPDGGVVVHELAKAFESQLREGILRPLASHLKSALKFESFPPAWKRGGGSSSEMGYSRTG
jgi:hypothetical protein